MTHCSPSQHCALSKAFIAAMGLMLVACNDSQISYDVDVVVPSSKMHGVHGLAIDQNGLLYGASLIGQSIYTIDPSTGKVTTLVGPTKGNADDVAIGPNGMIAWTAGLENAVYALEDENVITLASNLPGTNSINFAPDGRLFATTIFGGDALYEISRDGTTPARKVADKLGGLNGFEIAEENKLYGPLFFRGQIVEVDIETGDVSTLVSGIKRPAAVNLDQDGNIIGVDIDTGEVFRVNKAGGDKDTLITLEPPLDNLAISENGTVYISNPAFNRITAFNPSTGDARIIVSGGMSSPGGLAMIEENGRRKILASDFWDNRIVDAQTGDISLLEVEGGLAGASYIAADDTYYYASAIWPLPAVQIIDRATKKTVKMIAGFKSPYAIAPLPDGRLLVADYDANQLIEISADDKRTKRVIAENLEGPVGLALADADHIYVSEYNGGLISKIALKDGQRDVILSDLSEPEGLALNGEGGLLYTEVGRDRVRLYNPADKTARTVAAFLDMGLTGWGAMPAPFIPSGITVDTDGTIYVASDIKNALYRLTPIKAE